MTTGGPAFWTLIVTALATCVAAPERLAAEAAPSTAVLTKEQRRILLDLEESHLKLRHAEAREAEASIEYEQMTGLQERGVVTGQELRFSREKYERSMERRASAELDLQRTLLGSLSDATHISVESGQKFGTADGKVRVRIVVRNHSDFELAQVVETAWQKFMSEGLSQDIASLLGVTNIFVAILSDGVLVGNPYEIRIPALELGGRAEVVFGLQKPEVDEVAVQLEFLQRLTEQTVYLQKASATDIVRIQTDHFSQEGPLGSVLTYDLHAERLAESERTFTVQVIGLPPTFRWVLENMGRTVSQLRFSRNSPSFELTLNVFVPESEEGFEIDEAIEFLVVAHNGELSTTLMGSPAATTAELDALGVGYERLQVVPTGVAEVEFATLSLYT